MTLEMVALAILTRECRVANDAKRPSPEFVTPEMFDQYAKNNADCYNDPAKWRGFFERYNFTAWYQCY